MDERELKPKEAAGTTGDPATRNRPRFRIGAAVAIAAGAGLAAWAIVEHGRQADSSPASAASPPTATAATTAKPIGPVALSAQGLRTLMSTVDQPVYWAGPRAGFVYELTRTNTGKVYIRYLPAGVQVGSKKQIYLIVATYPFANSLEALKKLGGTHVTIPRGGVAMVDQSHPQSVHLAYPGVDDQIEVYDPSPARSLRVARSGTVVPVSP